MKKRAAEALAVLAVLIILFAALNRIGAQISEATVKIDGDYYNTGISELSLTLMTEDGLENLAEFPRLTSLKIIPFKEAAANAAIGNNTAADENDDARAAILAEYSNCTELSHLEAISNLTGLEKLDVSYCHVTNLEFALQMQSLTSLNIGCTLITDLSPLKKFPRLERLIIYGTPAENLSPLLEIDSLLTVIMSKETAEEFPEIITALTEKGVAVETRE